MKRDEQAKLKAILTQADGSLKPVFAGKGHAGIAEILRERTTEVDRDDVTGGMIASSIVDTEYKLLQEDQKSLLRLYCSAGTLPLTKALKQALTDMFPKGSETQKNLKASMKRPATLAEQDKIPQPTESDIADALRI